MIVFQFEEVQLSLKTKLISLVTKYRLLKKSKSHSKHHTPYLYKNVIQQQQKDRFLSADKTTNHLSNNHQKNINPQQMEHYINMNDSFGNKHSVSSTKSFQTYEQSIQTMREQLYNHQKALETAENIVEQYQQENERLVGEISELREAKLRIEQKYEVLENLFIKLDKAKEKEMHKQVKRAQQKHQLEIQNLNANYEQNICSLNQRIFFLELQLHKYENKQKKYQNLLSSYQQKHTTISTTSYAPIQSGPYVNNKPSMIKRQQQQISEDSLQKVYLKTATKPTHIQRKQPRNSIKSTEQPRVTTKPHIQLTQDLTKGSIIIDRGSVDRKKGKSRNTEYKEKGLGERIKYMRQSQVRVNTAQDYFSHKLQMINKTTQKPKHLFIYDNNFTDYKDYRDMH